MSELKAEGVKSVPSVDNASRTIEMVTAS
jgi:hypothetical protein